MAGHPGTRTLTVIAYDGRYVASDKLAVSNGGPRTVTKLRVHGGKVLAFSGDYAHGLALTAWYMGGAPANSYPPILSHDREAFLAVFEKGKHVMLYEGSPVPAIFEDPFFATGCGRDAAMATLHLGYSAKKAVEVASLCDVHCGRGVDVIDLWEIASDQVDGRKDAPPGRASRTPVVGV